MFAANVAAHEVYAIFGSWFIGLQCNESRSEIYAADVVHEG
jgi:hypothetical protein